MKRHLFCLSPLEGALVACSALAILAFVFPADLVADEPKVATRNGDLDADGEVDLTDAIYLFNYLYRGGPKPKFLACEPFAEFHNGDVNASGQIDLSDGIYILNWLFSAGRPPVEPCLGASG